MFCPAERADRLANVMIKARRNPTNSPQSTAASRWVDRKAYGGRRHDRDRTFPPQLHTAAKVKRALIIASATLKISSKSLISQWFRDSVHFVAFPQGSKIFGVADDVIEAVKRLL